MYQTGFYVSPLSRDDIRQVALNVRLEVEALKSASTDKFDIVEYLDILLPQKEPIFKLEICTRGDMGNNLGLAFPSENLICIREDVYDRAVNGSPKDRMTLAHELGHYKLHNRIGFAKQWPIQPNNHLRYSNSEWQADCFGGELLVDIRTIHQCKNVTAVMTTYGVSWEAAVYQLNAFRNRKR